MPHAITFVRRAIDHALPSRRRADVGASGGRAGVATRSPARRAYDAGWEAGMNDMDIRLAPAAPDEVVDAWHEGYALGRAALMVW